MYVMVSANRWWEDIYNPQHSLENSMALRKKPCASHASRQLSTVWLFKPPRKWSSPQFLWWFLVSKGQQLMSTVKSSDILPAASLWPMTYSKALVLVQSISWKGERGQTCIWRGNLNRQVQSWKLKEQNAQTTHQQKGQKWLQRSTLERMGIGIQFILKAFFFTLGPGTRYQIQGWQPESYWNLQSNLQVIEIWDLVPV